VAKIHLPEASVTGLAIVELAQPITQMPLRLGYSKLVHLADPVWAVSWPQLRQADAGSDVTADQLPAHAAVGQRGSQWALRTLIRGDVEKFEFFPEHGLQLIKTGLGVAAESGGGPLFNELGEVVGILVTRGAVDSETHGAQRTLFAVSVDALTEFLDASDLDRCTGDDRAAPTR
jgi:hypothetical protein